MLTKNRLLLLPILIAAGGFPLSAPAQDRDDTSPAPADRSERPSTPAPVAQEVVQYVPVASYVNRPEIAVKEGATAAAILETFHPKATGVATITLSVPAACAPKVRYLLATAIMEEGFHIKLIAISPKTLGVVTVSPKTVIREYLKHAPATIVINQHFPAPNGRQSITYRLYDDAKWNDDDYSNEAVLLRGNGRVYSFTRRGRGFYFSWSPDSRYLLIPFVDKDRGMNVYSIDTSRARLFARDLHLDAIADRVEARLPWHQHSATAGCSAIDVDKIEWSSAARCRLHYRYAFDEKSGNAVLDLNLAARLPRLRIVSITPTPE